MLITGFLALVLTLMIGTTLYLTNRQRETYKAFLLFSCVLSLWIACVLAAITAGVNGGDNYITNVIFWLRANTAVSSLAPGALLLIVLCIINNPYYKILSKTSFFILLICLAISTTALRDDFLEPDQISPLTRGNSYYLHAGLSGVFYTVIGVITWRSIGSYTGLKRLELQYIAIACGATAIAVTLLNTLGNLTGLRVLNRSSILVIVVGYLFMGWALAHHRIFNARQVLANVAHRGGVLICLVLSTWLLSQLLQMAMPETAAWVTSTVACGLGAIWLDDRTRPLLGLDHERALAGLRGEIITAAQGPADADGLRLACESILARDFRTEQAAILTLQGGHFAAGRVRIARDRSGFNALIFLGWITPESLERRRPSAAHGDLAAILETHRISAAVAIPKGSPDPTLLVTLGSRADDWPVTYPEIQRLQGVAELIDSILTRSRLTDQIALQNRIEHLGMMSRALAHDLKNLITPVNAFLVHTEGGFPPRSEAAQVHASAHRAVETITDYVREALFFGENLRPSSNPVDLRALFARVCATTAAHAESIGVAVVPSVTPETSLTGDFVLLERMLVNLVHNALDASNAGTAVRLTAVPGHRSRVHLQVSDEGSGISREVRDRIFDPYFTTKQHGREIRGFGLGLTIVQKIAHLHRGSVSVDSTPGLGATFTVDLPSNPSPSGSIGSGDAV
jgi:signal transduction histidine kinase